MNLICGEGRRFCRHVNLHFRLIVEIVVERVVGSTAGRINFLELEVGTTVGRRISVIETHVVACATVVGNVEGGVGGGAVLCGGSLHGGDVVPAGLGSLIRDGPLVGTHACVIHSKALEFAGTLCEVTGGAGEDAVGGVFVHDVEFRSLGGSGEVPCLTVDAEVVGRGELHLGAAGITGGACLPEGTTAAVHVDTIVVRSSGVGGQFDGQGGVCHEILQNKSLCLHKGGLLVHGRLIS